MLPNTLMIFAPNCVRKRRATLFAISYFFFASTPPHLVLLRSGAGVRDHSCCDKPVPDEQDDHSANSSADKTCTLVGPVPANQLADPSCEKRPHNTEHGGENEA